MDTTLQEENATRFNFHEKEYFLEFLNEWMDLELAKYFQLIVVVPDNKRTPYLFQNVYIIQVIPNGETSEEDKKFLGMLDEWIDQPSSQDGIPYKMVTETFSRCR